MKLWKCYTRRKSTKEPEQIVRCVGVYTNGYVVQRASGDVWFVPKNDDALGLYFPVPRVNLENK